MNEELLNRINAFINDNKGKRKFVQSVELAINFRGIDFNKTDNRLNLSVVLPNGRGKQSTLAIFADDPNIIEKAKKLNINVIRSSELQEFSNDQVKQNSLLSYELLAQPSLMPQIARALGQFLGPRNKMPRLVTGDIETLVNNASKSIYIRSRGKYLPTVHCMVGTESMPIKDVASNIDAVINEVTQKVGKQSIRSVYLKLTMSSPIKIM